jgi:site-specific DNA-methyltransferase (adenine-specific)
MNPMSPEERRIEKFNHGALYLGDARELIRGIRDKSVDLILTDPPFGLEADRFDDPEVFFELEDELYRVAKENAWLVFFFSTKKLSEAFRLRRFRYAWQFVVILSHGVPKKSPFGDVKYWSVLVFSKGHPKPMERSSDILMWDELPGASRLRTKNSQFKSTFANSKFISMFSREGDTVLDPFAGFGSVPLVCEMFRRRWIAFEIDPEKFEKAAELIRYLTSSPSASVSLSLETSPKRLSRTERSLDYFLRKP